MNRRLLLAGALTASILAATSTPADSQECRAPRQLLDLGRPLKSSQAAVAGRHALRIVAMGTSQVYGASAPQFSYPVQLKKRLSAALPGIAIHVFNKNVGSLDDGDDAARIKEDIQPERADLVIWQVGTNSAIRQVPLDKFAARLRAGIDVGRALGPEFILVNLQYVPAVAALPDEEEYARVMSEVAREKGVALFRRFEIMRAWYDDGMPYAQFVTSDGLHLNDFGQMCIGRLLAAAIVNALKDTN
jgi:lysophospholipase L1-like esterase